MNLTKRKKTIHDLQLHETVNIDDFQITRVPGGWIYRFYQPYNQKKSGGMVTEDYRESAVFVPFSTELIDR